MTRCTLEGFCMYSGFRHQPNEFTRAVQGISPPHCPGEWTYELGHWSLGRCESWVIVQNSVCAEDSWMASRCKASRRHDREVYRNMCRVRVIAGCGTVRALPRYQFFSLICMCTFVAEIRKFQTLRDSLLTVWYEYLLFRQTNYKLYQNITRHTNRLRIVGTLLILGANIHFY